MTRKSALPQKAHHILIYDEDWEFLDQAYGKTSSHPLGVSTVIRTIIHQKVLGIKGKINARLDAGEEDE
jgi:hypothetical protein